MQDQFIPYNLALELKELGFNEECLAFYSAHPGDKRKWMILPEFEIRKELYLKNDYGLNTVTAPLWQQVFDWFREEKKLLGLLYPADSGDFIYTIETFENNGKDYRLYQSGNYSYKEARLLCINKLIEICKSS